jgi:hypothetical protein
MEPLSDPKGDRFVKSLKPPPHLPLHKHLIWPGGRCNLILNKIRKTGLENDKR